MGDELMHYGVRGMKWGIRRYQPYPDGKEGKFLGKKQAKRLIKTMNRNAYTMANAKYMLDKTNKRIAKYSYKGKTSKVTLENMDKEFHEKTIAKAKEAINEAIKYLDDAGYTVSSKTKNKMMVDKGKAKVNTLLGGAIGALILAPRREVTQYKAKEKKIYDWNDKNNALKPDLAKSLSKAGLDDGDFQDINRAWQKANNAKEKKKVNLKKLDTTTTGQFFLTDYQDKAISPRDATEALLRSGINIKKDSNGKHRQTDKNFVDNNANENAYVKRMLSDPDKRRKFYDTYNDMKMKRIDEEGIEKGLKPGSIGFEEWKHKKIYGW